MRIPRQVFAGQFGHEGPEINFTEGTDESSIRFEILLGMNKLFTSQPGFQSTSLEKEAALNFAMPPEKDENQEDFVSVLLKI